MHLQLLQQRSSPVVQVLKLHCTITRHKHKLTCINAHIIVFFFLTPIFDKKRQETGTQRIRHCVLLLTLFILLTIPTTLFMYVRCPPTDQSHRLGSESKGYHFRKPQMTDMV